jgi:hypothetical protein
MTEGDELGHTEKVWVLRAALDRDAVDAHQWGCAPVGMRTSGDAHQWGCALGGTRTRGDAQQGLG